MAQKSSGHSTREACSYEEEATALELAANWMLEHCAQELRVLICTDRKSICQKLIDNSIIIAATTIQAVSRSISFRCANKGKTQNEDRITTRADKVLLA